MLKIEIPTHVLAACVQIAPKSDTRTSLLGVLIEVASKGDAFAVATDGYVMIACALGDTTQEAVQVIIPRATAEMAVKGAGKAPTITLAESATGWQIGAVSFVPVDGRFPDWRRVACVPTEPESIGQYDPEKIAHIWKAVAKASGRTNKNPVPLRQCGPERGLYIAERTIGVITPWRTPAPDAAFAMPY